MGLSKGRWHEDAIKHGIVKSGVGVNLSAIAAAATGAATVVPSATLDAISEAQWQEIVVGFAVAHAWRYAHCRKVKVKRGKREWWETTMPAGWFDLVFVRDRVIYAELKVRPNVQTAEQVEWAEVMRKAGQDVRLWYPDDWKTVQETLL